MRDCANCFHRKPVLKEDGTWTAECEKWDCEFQSRDETVEGGFTIEELRAWLREIMINNSDNSLGDACIDIRDRLDGFVRFVKERREGAE